MKRLLSALVILIFLSQTAQAQNFTFDPGHTTVLWRVRLLGLSKVNGKFMLKQGFLRLDQKSPAKNAVKVSIDAASLTTGIGSFDTLLKGADFLDTDKYSEASFKSTKVTLMAGGTRARVAGRLTLHGVTRPVILGVALEKKAQDAATGKKVLSFRGVMAIRRSDFGLLKLRSAVADDVKIIIETEAKADTVQK